MAEFEIIDHHGRCRRGRPGEKFADGERAVFPLQLVDAATRELMDAVRAYGDRGCLRLPRRLPSWLLLRRQQAS
jgi:hypothetical protein